MPIVSQVDFKGQVNIFVKDGTGANICQRWILKSKCPFFSQVDFNGQVPIKVTCGFERALYLVALVSPSAIGKMNTVLSDRVFQMA